MCHIPHKLPLVPCFTGGGGEEEGWATKHHGWEQSQNGGCSAKTGMLGVVKYFLGLTNLLAI